MPKPKVSDHPSKRIQVFLLTDFPGFTKDIGAHPDDLNLAVSLFFITFVLFQPPSAAVGRWMGAKNWVPIIMVREYVR